MEMDIQAILWAILCMPFGEHRCTFLLGRGLGVDIYTLGLNLTVVQFAFPSIMINKPLMCLLTISICEVPVLVLTIFLFFFLAVPRGLQDLSSLTRDRTCAPCSGRMES